MMSDEQANDSNGADKLRFDIGDLLPIGMTLVVLGIALAYGLDVMSDVKDETASCDQSGYTYDETNQVCDNGSNTYEPTNQAYNATEDAVTGVAKIPEKLPTIVTVVVAAIVVGILVRYLYVQFA